MSILRRARALFTTTSSASTIKTVVARPVSKDADIPEAEDNLKRSSLVPVDAFMQLCAVAVTLLSMMTAFVLMLNDMLKLK